MKKNVLFILLFAGSFLLASMVASLSHATPYVRATVNAEAHTINL